MCRDCTLLQAWANLLHGTACSAHPSAVTPAGPTVAENSLILPHTEDPNPQSMHALIPTNPPPAATVAALLLLHTSQRLLLLLLSLAAMA